MMTYKLAQEHSVTHLLPPTLNECLGHGADGEVFSLKMEYPEKVLKLSIMYPDFVGQDPQEKLKKFHKVFSHLLENKPSCYAKVFAHRYLGCWKREYDGLDFLLHYYTMERLSKTTEDERKVFHTILSHEDNNIVKNYSLPQLKETLNGLSKGLDFDMEKVILFSDNLKKTSISHNDLHSRNIMKDARGNFKLIDLDRATLEI